MEQNVIEAGFQKVWEMFQETAKRFRETDEKLKEMFQETDKRFRETDEKLKEKFQETDRKIQETDKQLKEFLKGLKKLEDTFITKWGRFMEVLVNSGATSALRAVGLSVDHSAKNFTQEVPDAMGRGMEIDVLCWGEDIVVPIEVKTTLKVEDVDEHIEKLGRFFECFPNFRGMKLYGAVAGLDFAGGSNRYAYKKGLYVLTLKGNKVVEVSNDGKFRPKIWG